MQEPVGRSIPALEMSRPDWPPAKPHHMKNSQIQSRCGSGVYQRLAPGFGSMRPICRLVKRNPVSLPAIANSLLMGAGLRTSDRRFAPSTPKLEMTFNGHLHVRQIITQHRLHPLLLLGRSNLPKRCQSHRRNTPPPKNTRVKTTKPRPCSISVMHLVSHQFPSWCLATLPIDDPLVLKSGKI